MVIFGILLLRVEGVLSRFAYDFSSSWLYINSINDNILIIIYFLQ